MKCGRYRFALPIFYVGIFALWGCSNRPSRIHPPDIDAAAAGRGAIEQYDTNKDGFISGPELEKAGSIRAALKQLDTNGDGKVSAEEVTARVQTWQDTKFGRLAVGCTVRHQGRPLAGATVTFVPEKFLGEEIQAGSGTTNSKGMAAVSLYGVTPPGMACGLYRVEISKKEGDREIIPAMYNTETVLGEEVASDSAIGGYGMVFELR